MTAIRLFARLFYFSALAAALILSSLVTQSHAQSGGPVGPGGGALSPRADTKPPTTAEALARFTENLTEKALHGRTEPFIGEPELINKITEIMTAKKGTKAFIILGESGAGKTAMMEHVAKLLEGKTIYSLRVQDLITNTTYRGQYEENIKAILEHFKANPNDILFIDEMKAIVEPGNEALRNALLPPIARGEISAAMATTEIEFKEHVEADTALVNRSEILRIKPANEKALINMLRARKASLEKFYGIPLSDAAIRKAAKLVIRFEPSESRRRKLINVIEGAMAREKTSRKLGNYDLRAVESEIAESKLAYDSLLSDAPRNQGNSEFLKELEAARNELAGLEQKKGELQLADKIEKAQLELNLKLTEIQTLKATGKLEQSMQIQYSVIPDLEQKIRNLKAEPVPHSGDITPEHIIRYYAQEKGISMSVAGDDEQKRLNDIETKANQRVLFQRQAIAQTMQQLRIRAANVEEAKPVLLFWDGPNGVGKTELAKTIAELDGRELVRVDANQHQDGNPAWKLFGSGQGYVDSARGGELEPVRVNGNVVVLVDEANLNRSEAFWNLWFQIGSEGIARDSRGRTIDFRQAIIIFAGNYTQNYATYKAHLTNAQIEQMYQLPKGSLEGLSQLEKDAKVLDRAMQMHNIPPGMRDRTTGTTTFDALDLPKTTVVAQLQLDRQAKHIENEHKVKVTWGKGVAEAVAKAGFDIEFNVRPIARSRSNNISALLADLQPKWKAGDKVHIDFEAAQDGKGGVLTAKVNEVEVNNVRQVIFKTLTDPKAAAARLSGEAGKPKDPTSRENRTQPFRGNQRPRGR
jgi:ATP-dependent Clp protease ATP-binding subunit ClpB